MGNKAYQRAMAKLGGKAKMETTKVKKQESMPFKFKVVGIDTFELSFETLVSNKLFDQVFSKSLKEMPAEEREKVEKTDAKYFETPKHMLGALKGKLSEFVNDVRRQLKPHNRDIVRWDLETVKYRRYDAEDSKTAVWLVKLEVKGVYTMV